MPNHISLNRALDYLLKFTLGMGDYTRKATIQGNMVQHNLYTCGLYKWGTFINGEFWNVFIHFHKN